MKKIIVLLLIGSIFGCKNENINVPKNFDFGKIENNVYRNNYFNLTLSVSPNWYQMSDSQIRGLNDAGVELISNRNENLKEILDVSKINVAPLLGVFKYEIGTSKDFNPSISMNAENLNNFPNVKSGKEYLEAAKEFLNQTGMDISFKKSIDAVLINGTEFFVLEIENTTYGYTIFQKNYCVVRNGFAINSIISYKNEEDLVTLMKMIDSIEYSVDDK